MSDLNAPPDSRVAIKFNVISLAQNIIQISAHPKRSKTKKAISRPFKHEIAFLFGILRHFYVLTTAKTTLEF